MVISLVISLIVVILTWPHRNYHGVKAMLSLLIGIFIWTLGFLLESHSQTLERQLLWNNVGYLGSMTVPVAWFIFALNYSNNAKMIYGWRTALLCVTPIIITALIWTNGWHHLMWSNAHLSTSGDFLVTVKTYGPFFWVALAYNYILIFLGGIILLRRLFVGKRLYRYQAAALIVSVLLPWIWNIIYVFNLVSLPRKDLTPVMFAISGLVLAVGFLRFHLFAVIPFAPNFVINYLNDGIFAFNIHNRLVDANPAALQMLQLDESIIGKKLENIPSLSSHLGSLSPNFDGHSGLPLMLPREKRICELETTPMVDEEGERVGWLAIFHDITELKQAEEKAQESEALKKLDRLRTELLANVSHELRTPLASIKGFASTLLRTDTKWSETEQRDFLNTIEEEADRLNRIIGDILDISRIDAGALKLNLAIHDISEILTSVRDRLTRLTLHHPLEINVPLGLPPIIMVDDMRISQVLSNLVENAVKYSPEGSKITIDVKYAQDEIIVSVIDRGIGISPEAISRLFDRFYQVDSVVHGQKKWDGVRAVYLSRYYPGPRRKNLGREQSRGRFPV